MHPSPNHFHNKLGTHRTYAYITERLVVIKTYSPVFPLHKHVLLNSVRFIYRTHWLSGSQRRGPGQNNIGAALHLAIFGNAPPDTLSLSRQIKQSTSILWSAENQIWSIFIPLPSRLSSSLSVLVVPITVFVYSYCSQDRSESWTNSVWSMLFLPRCSS